MIRRRRHRRHSGFTLIEIMVSLALLALIGGSITAVTAVGIRTVGPGGAGHRLTGDHDLIALEQMLGKDIGRAECVYEPPTASAIYSTTGECKSTGPAHSYCTSPPSLPAGATVLFCTAWSQYWETPAPAGTSGSCHIAAYYRYISGGTTAIYRRETDAFVNQTPTPAPVVLSAVAVTSGDVSMPTAAPTATPLFANDIPISLAAIAPAALQLPPSAQYHFHPLGTIVQTGAELC
jgi:prepilin-type N-terminal cleavage/methylation domain-containing protein